ncbi:hypothetical protein CY34DRAFT_651015 [Suillus luteus UH-Slu-Lm8-n1]|uniref:Uncharacterized protein n=1 Tax=Suillus luteus UH-Slu-Lm8-n1 TaxID=930992 RepID=A0A0D0AR13_9AGAM|nr:hypothetical protein CY34DRAFT_651015 [Suillus luteus UH-Slu-Lm8-n1]
MRKLAKVKSSHIMWRLPFIMPLQTQFQILVHIRLDAVREEAINWLIVEQSMYASSTTRRVPVTANAPPLVSCEHSQSHIKFMHSNPLSCVIAEQCTQSAVTGHHIIPQNVGIYRDFKTC